MARVRVWMDISRACPKNISSATTGVVMSRNWSEGIFGCRFVSLRRLSEKYTLVQKKICNPELHDIPACPAQLPHNYACKYKRNMKDMTEQDNTAHKWQNHRKWMVFHLLTMRWEPAALSPSSSTSIQFLFVHPILQQHPITRCSYLEHALSILNFHYNILLPRCEPTIFDWKPACNGLTDRQRLCVRYPMLSVLMCKAITQGISCLLNVDDTGRVTQVDL